MARYDETLAQLGGALEALYAAGSGEVGWDLALGEVAAELGGDIAALFTDRPGSATPFACLSNATPDVESVFASWNDTARHLDPLRISLDKLPQGHATRVSDLMAGADFRNSAFYVEYAGRFGGTDCLDIDLERTPSSLLNLCIYGQDGRTLRPDAKSRVEQLLPHVRRSLRLDQLIAGQSIRHLLAMAAIDELSTPVIAVDGRLSIVFASTSAKECLANDNGLNVRSNILDASERQYPAFASVLRQAMHLPRMLPNVTTVPVVRSNRRPLAITVVVPAIRNEFWASTGLERGAILFVGDSESDLAAVEHSLQQVHGLTNRESDVAIGLANGLTLEAIALRSGVGVETVRSQLKQAFAKTGTARQAELVRLVLLELGHRRRMQSHSDPIEEKCTGGSQTSGRPA